MVIKEYCEAIFTSKKLTKSSVKTGNVTFFGSNLKNIFESVIDKEFERCVHKNRIYSNIRYLRSKIYNDTMKPYFVGQTKVLHIWEVIKNIQHTFVFKFEIHLKVVVLELKDKQYVCKIPNTIEAQ